MVHQKTMRQKNFKSRRKLRRRKSRLKQKLLATCAHLDGNKCLTVERTLEDVAWSVAMNDTAKTASKSAPTSARATTSASPSRGPTLMKTRTTLARRCARCTIETSPTRTGRRSVENFFKSCANLRHQSMPHSWDAGRMNANATSLTNKRDSLLVKATPV